MFCSECGNQIADRAVVCPKCGTATKNFGYYVRRETTPIQSAPLSEPVGRGTLICAYILCFIAPFFGFLAGLYLTLRKNEKSEKEHGVICLFLSIFLFALYFALLSK